MSVLSVLKEIAGEFTEPETSCVVQVRNDPAPANRLTLDCVAYEFFTEDQRRAWLVLDVRRSEKPPTGPITVGPSQRIVVVSKFTESTIRDLVTYVSAKNRNSYHWVNRVLDEKIELLERCGVKAEIRAIQ